MVEQREEEKEKELIYICLYCQKLLFEEGSVCYIFVKKKKRKKGSWSSYLVAFMVGY